MTVLQRFDFNANPGAAAAWQAYPPETGSGTVTKISGSDVMVAAANAGFADAPSGYVFAQYRSVGISTVDGSISISLALGNSSDMVQLDWRVQGNGDCYTARIEAGQVRVWRMISGSVAAEPINVGAGISYTADQTRQTVRIEFAGTGITVKINGTTVATGTDGGITTAGGFGWSPRALGGYQIEFAEAADASAPGPVLSGAATLDDITASGGLTSAAPSTLSGGATLDDVAASGGITSAPVVGTFTSESLRWNNDTVEASVALTWLSFRNITTGAVVLDKTGISTNSLGVFSVADALLVPGTAVRADWKTATGHHGWGIATPV